MTRYELYKAVWSRSMVKIAEEYGISVVGLKKACKKHNIPTPGRGYWAKVQAGHKVKKVKLPKASVNEIICFGRVAASQRKAKDKNVPQERLVPVPIPDTLKGAHPAVKELMNDFKSRKYGDSRGGRFSSKWELLSMTVTRELLRRALLLANALVKELERRRYYSFENPRYAVIEGQKIRFVIEEPYKVKKIKLNPPLRYGTYVQKYDREYYAAGILRLRIKDYSCFIKGCKVTWSDGKKQKVEDCLADFIQGMEIVAQEELRIELEKQKEEEERRRESQRRSQEYERASEIYTAEEVKYDSLISDARSWKKSTELRDYIDAFRQHKLEESGALDEETQEWIEWAYQQADRLDPFKPSPPSVLDSPRPQHPSYW